MNLVLALAVTGLAVSAAFGGGEKKVPDNKADGKKAEEAKVPERVVIEAVDYQPVTVKAGEVVRVRYRGMIRTTVTPKLIGDGTLAVTRVVPQVGNEPGVGGYTNEYEVTTSKPGKVTLRLTESDKDDKEKAIDTVITVEGEALKHAAYDGYTVADDAGQGGKASCRVFTDRAGFDKAFQPAGRFGFGDKPDKARAALPAGAFDAHLVAAVVMRGNAVVSYKVEDVTADGDGTVTVRYATKASEGGSATFACPLVVTVPKAGVKRVVFVADGKAAGTAEVK